MTRPEPVPARGADLDPALGATPVGATSAAGPPPGPLTSPVPEPVPDPGMVADAVAAVTLAVPGVTALHTGAFGEVATYLPGRKVGGIRLAEDVAEVHVAVLMGVDVLHVAEAVRQVVLPLVDTPLHVYVEDVTVG